MTISSTDLNAMQERLARNRAKNIGPSVLGTKPGRSAESSAAPLGVNPAWLKIGRKEHSDITCEADQHREILKWAKFNGIIVRHSRMDCEHGEGNGEPDFIAMKWGRVCAVEQKHGKNKPTKAQRDRMAEYEAAGIPGLFSWTVADTCAFMRKHLLKPTID